MALRSSSRHQRVTGYSYSENQKRQLSDYTANGYKTLVSNDYDLILKEIEDYMHAWY